MRIAIALTTCFVAQAQASPCAIVDTDPTLPGCDQLRISATHTLGASAAAGVIASEDAGGALLTTSARADVSYTLGLGDDADFYQVELAAGATARRLDGAAEAFGGSTRLRLRAGSVPPPADVRHLQRTNMSVFPLTFELEHEGELAALPALSARADVARSTYSSQHVELTTRALRFSAVGGNPSAADPANRVLSGVNIDIIPAWFAADLTMQEGTRIDGMGGGALLGVSGDARDADFHAIVGGFEQHGVTLPDGRQRAWLVAWLFRVQVQSPVTGTTYRIGWGILPDDFTLLGRVRDHRDDNIVELGLGDLRSAMIQYQRTPYLMMSGGAAIEDRVSAELVLGGPLHVATHAFVARTERATAILSSMVDWTAGVEADGSHRVHGVDVGLRAELGRSFYGAIDDGAPSPGFGARLGLSVSRAIARTYTR